MSVLELGKIWERSLRRAGMPLKYSQGFNPRPKLNFAAPLPVGCGCEADLMDVWLETPVEPEAMTGSPNRHSPARPLRHRRARRARR